MAASRFTRLVLGFLLLAFGCQGCGGWSGPRLSDGHPNPGLVGVPGVSPAHHAVIGEMFLCLTSPGRAVITAVRPVRPVGRIEVIDFAVRPNPFLRGGEMLGSDIGTLRTHGFPADRVVGTPCGAANSGHGYELGLELAVPPGTNAGTSGWEIYYSVGGQAASIVFPYGAVLCSTPSLYNKPCMRVGRKFGIH